jgi:hypothetical protein
MCSKNPGVNILYKKLFKSIQYIIYSNVTQHDILFMKKRKPDLSRIGLDWLVCIVVYMSRIDMSRLRR